MLTRYITAALVLVTMLATGSDAQSPLGTVFTYQGRLTDGGAPADGSYNVDFSLWDAASMGNQVGSTIMFNSLSVSDGLINVELDFGAEAFDNTGRWLEIAVDGTPLSPRQPITRAPYSIQTRGIFVDEDENVGLGTTSPFARFDVVTQTINAGNNTARFSAPNLGPRTSHIHYGSTGDWYIRSADDVLGKVVLQDTGGRVGIGTSFPTSRLEVLTDDTDSFAIFGRHTATSDVYYGVFGRSNSTSGRGVYGYAQASSGTNFGVYGRSDSTSGFDFYAAGAGTNYGSSSSIRWKSNIDPIDDPLYKLGQLRGVYFDWDSDHGGHHDIGMIAEEVGAVIPEIVNYEENGVDAIGMDYSKLTPLLVEAVNALRAEKRAEIEALRAENEELRARLEELEAMVHRMMSTHEGAAR